MFTFQSFWITAAFVIPARRRLLAPTKSTLSIARSMDTVPIDRLPARNSPRWYTFHMVVPDLDILRDYNATRQCIDKGSICHAPESSMYFGRDGMVSACCYSRANSWGRYPDQSIDQIWTSAQARAMRAGMRRNELPGGCELCGDQFYARNFKNFLAQQFDQNARPPVEPGVARFPVCLEFEASPTNATSSVACAPVFGRPAFRANREHLPPLPLMYDKAFVQQLVPFLPHLKKAKFLGGEPFLVDLYYDIWEHLIELNPECDISITTNGTVYTEKVRRVLEKLNCAVIVSLDSVNKETYESIRKNALLKRTLSNLESFSAINRRKDKGLNLAVCPMTSNYREIPELVSFANQRGMRVFFNTVIFPVEQSIKILPLEVQREIVELYTGFNPEPGTEIESANRDALLGFCRQIKYWMKENAARLPEKESEESSVPVRPPMEMRCEELLASRKESDSVTCLLADLAGNRVGPGSQLDIDAADPVHELKEYIRAIQEVGGILHSEGLLPDFRLDRDDVQALLDYFDRNVDPRGHRLSTSK